MSHHKLPTYILIIQLLSEERYVYYVRIEVFLKNVWTQNLPRQSPTLWLSWNAFQRPACGEPQWWRLQAWSPRYGDCMRRFWCIKLPVVVCCIWTQATNVRLDFHVYLNVIKCNNQGQYGCCFCTVICNYIFIIFYELY